MSKKTYMLKTGSTGESVEWEGPYNIQELSDILKNSLTEKFLRCEVKLACDHKRIHQADGMETCMDCNDHLGVTSYRD